MAPLRIPRHRPRVYRNKLASLPQELGGLQALQTLYLSRNALASLPPELGGLQALRKLSCYGNKLASLPPEVEALMKRGCKIY